MTLGPGISLNFLAGDNDQRDEMTPPQRKSDSRTLQIAKDRKRRPKEFKGVRKER
jgi:hypothetical protein